MAERTVLIGAGWLGATTASHLAASGHAVWTLQRTPREAPAGCTAVTGDITTAASDAQVRAVLPDTVDNIVVCVAPSSGRGDSYAIYPSAARGAAALAVALGVGRVLYVSSTGIYDRQDGSEASESTPIQPTTARVQALFDAEREVAGAGAAGISVDVVRAAGLYGPGRDPAGRFAGGAVPGETWCNFSWRDDVAEAIRHLLARPATGEVCVFNCTDGHPVQAAAITAALTGAVPAAGAVSAERGRVVAGRSSQRIRVDALLATGWRPQVPTVFDGLRLLGHALPGLDAGVAS